MSTAKSLDLGALATSYFPDSITVAQLDGAASKWVIVGSPADVQPFAALGWADLPAGPVLTDDFSDLLRTLRP